MINNNYMIVLISLIVSSLSLMMTLILEYTFELIPCDLCLKQRGVHYIIFFISILCLILIKLNFTKQLLEKLGPDKFSKWLKKEKKIHFTDTTFRDAHQSLLATRVRTYDMLKVAESFSKNIPETFSMEVWGGATFDVSLRFLKECPWKRLELLRQAIPNILLQMLIRGSNAVGYKAYPDNLIERFIIEAAEKLDRVVLL